MLKPLINALIARECNAWIVANNRKHSALIAVSQNVSKEVDASAIHSAREIIQNKERYRFCTVWCVYVVIKNVLVLVAQLLLDEFIYLSVNLLQSLNHCFMAGIDFLVKCVWTLLPEIKERDDTVSSLFSVEDTHVHLCDRHE